MTNIEHMMLSVCFGMNVGWMLGGLMIIITDGIKLLKERHKAKKEQNINDDKERTGNNL
ncbi:hypothetical protein [Clostridium sp. OM05-9]|uniref:hypothetical protein n=1 Tax=Clostridium sp. OM05-9 TaxID=2293045 RepID=UPI0015F8F970|nr:hypothetical protein [Clostridium sp. OM05-9]